MGDRTNLLRAAIMATKSYTYGLVDPEHPYRVRYVGMTNNPRNRLMHHTGRGGGESVRVMDWLCELAERGAYPELLVLAWHYDGRALEANWTVALRRRGLADLNVGVTPPEYRLAPVGLGYPVERLPPARAHATVSTVREGRYFRLVRYGHGGRVRAALQAGTA